MKKDNDEQREQAALESLLGGLRNSRAESFSPGFAARVASAAALRSNDTSRQYEAFENLKSAFFGTAVAWAAACLVLFVWIRFHPNAQTVSNAAGRSAVKAQSVEDALQNVTYKAVEDLL